MAKDKAIGKVGGTHATNGVCRILFCNCKANTAGNTQAACFQDKRYGYGKRVGNPCAKGYSCTVCSSLHGIGSGQSVQEALSAQNAT